MPQFHEAVNRHEKDGMMHEKIGRILDELV